MKIVYKKIIALALAVMAVTAFSGCNNESSYSQTETTVAPTTVEATTVEPTTVNPNSDITSDLSSLHSYDIENGDELAGAWQITEGSGEQFGGFIYSFDGKGTAMLVLGNMGYLSEYTLDESNKTLEVQLVFGLNGKYSYKLSEDKKTITLTNSEDNSTTKIEKIDSYSLLPSPEKNPKIDEKLLGAWLSENGEYLYFDADGIMYQNLYGVNIIYSSYNTVDGVITSQYKMQNEELTDTYNYSVSGDVLTMNDVAYNKIPVSELK